MLKLKKHVPMMVALIITIFLLISCFEKNSLCSNDKGDLLRRACDVELKKS